MKAFLTKNVFLGLAHQTRNVIAGLTSNRRVSACEGFTLAEVLITLGIIGIVAAMTMPTLITRYQKTVVTTKLKKFYSVMSQAIKLEESRIGDIENWLPSNENDKFEKWFNEHLADQIAVIYKNKINKINSSSYKVGLKDGSGFIAYSNYAANRIHINYCTDLKYCNDMDKYDGRTTFLFSICPKEGFVTSLCNDTIRDKTRQGILESCKYGNQDNLGVSTPDKRHNCTRLIQMDGWEIKDDYPWKQTFLEKK